jgi:phosphate transport system permease protein
MTIATPEANYLAIRKRIERQKLIEKGIYVLLAITAISSIGITIGIMWVLIGDTISFFAELPKQFIILAENAMEAGKPEVAEMYRNMNPFVEFLTGTEWTPTFAESRYGILPLLVNTVMIAFVGVLVAIPFGTSIALYLSEFANSKLRETLKPLLELIAGVPSVVFGYFALNLVSPLVGKIADLFNYDLPKQNMLVAGLVIGVAIIPLVSSISEDAMRSVPVQMREGSYAMGATRMQTSFKVVIPAAFSGIIAAYILGISRAVGETMIVAIAAGGVANLTLNPLEAGVNISSFIVQITKGDLSQGTVEFYSLFAVGLTLALLTFSLNVIGFFLISKFRERY